MIDYTDPAQTTHQGKPIPVSTQKMFDAGKTMMKAMHGFYGVPFDNDADAQYETRVRNGMSLSEIEKAYQDDIVARYNVTLQ